MSAKIRWIGLFAQSGATIGMIGFAAVSQLFWADPARGQELGDALEPEAIPAHDTPKDASAWVRPIPGDPGAPEVAGVLYERWDEVKGRDVRALLRSPRFREAPSRRGLVDSLAMAEGDGREFGVRVRGFIVAPRSGKARFVLTSDGNSELWLSPNADPFARERVAWIKSGPGLGSPKPEGYFWAPSQWSEPIKLIQGNRYYFEAYHKSGRGPDHFSIRWSFDGFKKEKVVPIPASAFRPWSGSEFDADADGLPDEWQRRTGLAGNEKAAAWEDADGDQVTNFGEYRAGTDPMDGTATAGYLLWEIWDGIPGRDVADLVRNRAFSGPADRKSFLPGAVAPVMKCGNFGSRLSGCIVPKESGHYELAVSGDSAAELWFSQSPSRLDKKRVAFSPHWRRRGDWDFLESQHSVPFYLEAGKAYYVEAIHKDLRAPGWVGIAWRLIGEEKFVPVSPEFLRSPDPEAADADRDFLPDQFAEAALSQMLEKGRERVRFTQFGDPDRDGLPNWLEARGGTPLFERTAIPGAWVREWWFHQPGNSLERARREGALLPKPSMLTLADEDTAAGRASANFLVSRMRALVTPPEAGTYRFWISGDDQCELWLSTDDTKFRKRRIAAVMPEPWESEDQPVWTNLWDWDARAAQQSGPVELKADASYFIEVLHKEGSGDDHVEIAWQFRPQGTEKWSPRSPLPASAITSFPGDPDDIEDDYLPDSWEEKHGLDPKDNGLRDPEKQGENGDHDADGLTNREEYLRGTDPCSADTDGDGVGDYDEIKLYGSNPLLKDASPPVKCFDIALDTAEAAPGVWRNTDEGTMISLGRRGVADFTFRLEKPGIYKVEMTALARALSDYIPPVPVVVRVDAMEIGRVEVPAEAITRSWLTPWLAAGTHTVSIDNRNVRLGTSLEIQALSLYRHAGDDLDGNSIPDWMEKFFRRMNHADQSVCESVTSPICLEGVSRFASGVFVATQDAGIDVMAGLEGRWYANVPISPSGSEKVSVRFEGGALEQECVIRWATTNLFEVFESLRVRAGDSLRVVAVPPESTAGTAVSRLALDDETLGRGPADEPRIVTFDHPGKFTLSATVDSGVQTYEKSVSVTVLDADFGPGFSVAAGSSRIWDLPAVPRRISIESDPLLSLREIERDPEDSRRLEVRYLGGLAGSPRVVARLEAGGPIIAATSVNAFMVIAATRSLDAHLVTVLPDGTRVVKVGFLIDGDVPDDLSLWIDLYVTDAVFANGDTRYRLTAADFDEEGVAHLLIYKAPGEGVAAVCHWISPYGEENAPSAEENE